MKKFLFTQAEACLKAIMRYPGAKPVPPEVFKDLTQGDGAPIEFITSERNRYPQLTREAYDYVTNVAASSKNGDTRQAAQSLILTAQNIRKASLPKRSLADAKNVIAGARGKARAGRDRA